MQIAEWAIKSYTILGKRSDPIIVHDDGTLSSDDVDRLHLMSENCRVIPRTESDIIIADLLSPFPRLTLLRSRFPLMLKLLDVNLCVGCSKRLLLDTDVFTFSPLETILETATNAKSNTFMTDYQFALALPQNTFKALGMSDAYLPVNTGFAISDPQFIDLTWLEWICCSYPAIIRTPQWIEQTLYALVRGREKTLLFGPEIRMAKSAGLTGVSAKHYAGPARSLAFSEGIPFLSSNMPQHGRIARISQN